MLCSISTNNNNTKAGSNWLDRLRSSKGFPTTDNNHDLDHYLNNPEPDPTPSGSTPPSHDRVTQSQTQEQQQQQGENDMHKAITNVLSELFNMGCRDSSSGFSRKKFPRKQANPNKCCFVEGVRNDGYAPAAMTAVNGENCEVEDVEKEGGGDNERDGLIGFSKSDVTVIDTSFEVWKSEKWVFRRNDVWKVKEKRGKLKSSLGRKKRKGVSGNEGNGDDHGHVKKKTKLSSFKVRELSKDSDEGQSSEDGKRKEVPKESTSYFSQVPRKRIPFTRSPKKYTTGSSSVVLIQGIPAAKKSEAKVSNIQPKDTQHHKA